MSVLLCVNVGVVFAQNLICTFVLCLPMYLCTYASVRHVMLKQHLQRRLEVGPEKLDDLRYVRLGDVALDDRLLELGVLRLPEEEEEEEKVPYSGTNHYHRIE
jgi:hypothetical protein